MSTAWLDFADAVLQRGALLSRIARGEPPDPTAGLRITDAMLDRLLDELVPTADAADALDEARASLDVHVDRARLAFHEMLAGTAPFAILVGNAGLSLPEAEVLAVLVANELHTRRQRLLAYVQDDVNRRRLTLGTFRQLFGADHPGPLTVAPAGLLCQSGLVSVAADGPWADRTVAVAATVTWALQGDPSEDPDLPVGVTFVDAAVAPAGDPLVLVIGDDRRRRLEKAYATAAGTRFLRTDAPADAGEWDAVVREATLRGIGIVLEVDDDLDALARKRIEHVGHLPWAVVAPRELPLASLPNRAWVEHRAEDSIPTDDEWAAALGPDVERTHALTAAQLDLVATAFPGVGHDLDTAVRRLASGKIDRLTQRIRPQRTWDDLIVDETRLEQLHSIVDRHRHRDRVHADWGFSPYPSVGVVALFAGESGTGKTLAAEIIAGALELDLFRLDVASVVSKYIGETEKNLEEVFGAAEASSCVLLFDEADALFGKRTEVGDAHDRYANIEASYLLQRIERYDGIVLLTTNLQNNIDTAFLRRIDVAIEFPMPGVDERRAIWAHGFPSTAPTEGLDFDLLAERFEISGGAIRNVTLAAAFTAAARGTAIDMEAVYSALKREYRKTGRLITATEFG